MEYDEYEVNPEDYLEQYEVEIRDILAKAANDKIKNIIDELARVKRTNEEWQEQVRELRKELYNINRSHKEELDKALKENTKEVERRLGLGVAVNDTVWYVKSKSSLTKCEKCNGKGKVEMEVLGKMTEVKCPHCSGGNVFHYEYFPEKDTVKSLKFWVGRKTEDQWSKNKEAELKEKWDIDVWLDKYDNSMRRENLFKTEEECQKKCDEKNSKQ